MSLFKSQLSFAQSSDLDLEDAADIDLLLEDLGDRPSAFGDNSASTNDTEDPVVKGNNELKGDSDDLSSLEKDLDELNFNDAENSKEKVTAAKKTSEKDVKKVDSDDLDSLMEDLGDVDFDLPEDTEPELKEANSDQEKNKKSKINIVTNTTEESEGVSKKEEEAIFDVGRLEKELLEMSKKMQGKIPNEEWNEIAGESSGGTYEVVSGDWLWKISKNIFGSGFYYSKIWALNSFITNPHEIEPGMVLSFSTGSDNNLPALEILKARQSVVSGKEVYSEYERWGDEAKPDWIDERKGLLRQGVYLQYATGDTQKDLKEIGEQTLIKEYESYNPPKLDFVIDIPDDEYDAAGFDKNSKVFLSFKEGFYLNTFIANNVVQDFGKVESAIERNGYFVAHDTVFVRIDEKIDVIPGDKFSVYAAGGEKSHVNSDRKGFKYTISGTIEMVQKIDDLWQCKITEAVIPIARGDRLTVYTPKIDRITQSYNSRLVEAVIVSAFEDLKSYASFGDVVYLDRGRADGVEVGNVFEIYGFRDRGTGKSITKNPSYKNGELTVITVTDNFSTALVSQSKRDFIIGDIAVTKTKEAAARSTKLKNKISSSSAVRMNEKALDELDVELNLDDLNDALLDKADKIQFTEDELAELERQEREKSILTENEKDLKSLERLEGELETAEKMLKEARLDEDKLLQDEDLNKVEKNFGVEQQESLDELEENFGKRYLDEELNDKENPYGLTEFDIEEIDELLNAEKDSGK